MEFTLNLGLFFCLYIGLIFILIISFWIGYYLGLKKEEKEAIKKLHDKSKKDKAIINNRI